MRSKIFIFILAASVAVTLLSCKTAERVDQPAGPEVRTEPHDALPPTHEKAGKEIIKEPKEAKPAEKDAARVPDPDTYYRLGQSLYNTGQYKDAVVAFKETLDIEHNYDAARYDLARSYLMLDDHEAALREYKILLKTDPDMADALRKEAVKLASSKLIVQVGAFQHLNNAKFLIDELKEEYLFVYMDSAEGLYKVMINGIKDIKEGNRIMTEIKKKHDISPFLIINE